LVRREEVGKNIDYISRQLARLEVIERLPDAGVKTDQLVNRALDVLSASLNYLSLHIRHESGRLGILGRHIAIYQLNLLGSMSSTFFSGEKDFNSVEKDLTSAVDEFNSSLSQFGHGVGFKVFDLLQGISSLSYMQTP
jgi:hypothetical protein